MALVILTTYVVEASPETAPPNLTDPEGDGSYLVFILLWVFLHGHSFQQSNHVIA